MIKIKKLILILAFFSFSHIYATDKNNISLAKKNNIAGLKKLRSGSYKSAELYFNKAINLNPDAKQYYNNIAVAYMRQGEYPLAYQYLTICIKLDPGNPRALSNLAVTSFNMFNFREAYYFYMRAHSLNPEYIKNRFPRNRVIDYINKFSKKNPDNNNLSKILKIIGN